MAAPTNVQQLSLNQIEFYSTAYNLEIRFPNLEDDVFLLVLLDPIQLVFPRRFLASKVRLHQITRRAAIL